jgi:NADH-quinone oxidoreductase subunit J
MNTLALPLLLAEAKTSTQIIAWLVILLLAGFVLTPGLRALATSLLAIGIGAIAIATGLEVSSLLVTGSMLGCIGLICVVPPSRFDLRVAGAVFCVAGLGFYAYALSRGQASPQVEQLIEWIVFGILAITAVGSAIAMIASRSAVYSAIWFAVTLLTTGGLFLYQGAQFLGVATVTVYAGAIVVTFLFVIMLAQPDGHASYDRISWGSFAKPAAAIAAALLLGAVLHSLEGLEKGGLREVAAASADELRARDKDFPLAGKDIAGVRTGPRGPIQQLELLLTPAASNVRLKPAQETLLHETMMAKADAALPPVTVTPQPSSRAALDPQAPHTMAHLGGFLLSRHLIAVEVGGTLLLAALVGAIAMLSQGSAVAPREGEAHV